MADVDFSAIKPPPRFYNNVEVEDLGSGDYPRIITVRMPTPDGGLQNALWDGFLTLTVGDKLRCRDDQTDGILIIDGFGGSTSGEGKVSGGTSLGLILPKIIAADETLVIPDDHVGVLPNNVIIDGTVTIGDNADLILIPD